MLLHFKFCPTKSHPRIDLFMAFRDNCLYSVRIVKFSDKFGSSICIIYRRSLPIFLVIMRVFRCVWTCNLSLISVVVWLSASVTPNNDRWNSRCAASRHCPFSSETTFTYLSVTFEAMQSYLNLTHHLFSTHSYCKLKCLYFIFPLFSNSETLFTSSLIPYVFNIIYRRQYS